MKTRFATMALIVMLSGSVAYAGWPVTDWQAMIQRIQMMVYYKDQLTNLVGIYDEVRNQARWIQNRVKWARTNPPWRIPAAGNTSGKTPPFLGALQTGNGAAAAYDTLAVQLGMPQWNMISNPARFAQEYAGVELTDGASISTMETLGSIRANAPYVEKSLQDLQADVLSLDPLMNTQVGLLNINNAAALQIAQEQHDANQIMARIAEHQLLNEVRQRNAQASEINSAIAIHQDSATVADAYNTGAANGLAQFQTFRLQ